LDVRRRCTSPAARRLRGSLADVDTLYAAGQAGAIAQLLDYDSVPDPVWDDPNPLGLDDPLTNQQSARRTLLYKLAASRRPLQSRLAWCWHGHFTTNIEATNPDLMQRQMQTWRQFASAKFLDFLFAMYKDGAMLQYLDGDGNSKRRPNENFARENFELYTTGIGPYTETDIREAARAFTGYVVNGDNTVTFDLSRHDTGPKTILGQTGNFDGDDVMQIVAARPETQTRWRKAVHAPRVRAGQSGRAEPAHARVDEQRRRSARRDRCAAAVGRVLGSPHSRTAGEGRNRVLHRAGATAGACAYARLDRTHR
jgi:hypothetical protein